MTDPFNLRRFVEAQERDYPTVLEELAAGQKRSHWIWYIFPQIEGLGESSMSKKYAISSREEARAYSEHPILGPRLRECTRLAVNVEGRSADQVFPYPDNLKFRSCMTLFGHSATDPAIFRRALLKYFGGKDDQSTLDILERQAASDREPT